MVPIRPIRPCSTMCKRVIREQGSKRCWRVELVRKFGGGFWKDGGVEEWRSGRAEAWRSVEMKERWSGKEQ